MFKSVTSVHVWEWLTPAPIVCISDLADSRQSYDKIADQYMDFRINGKPKVDLILGGGQEFFLCKDRNLK